MNVPEGKEHGELPGAATIFVGGMLIADVRFVVAVQAESEAVDALAAGERHYRSAFASYAHEDRDAVLARIQGMRKVAHDLDVFLDVARLRSGQHWQAALKEEILRRDVMYLFWSKAASQSKWVNWEWRCALRERGIDFIDPCPLAPPDVVPPPKRLADKLHFNDWELKYMDGQPDE